MMMQHLSFLALALVVGFCLPGKADELVEERTSLPLRIGENIVRLDALLVRQSKTQGRLPIAVINPGTVTGIPGHGLTPASQLRLARDLAFRGWLAVAVVGRASPQADTGKPVTFACDAAAFKNWLSPAVDDLQATIRFVGQRDDADANRVIIIGSLSGGVAAVALSARNPSGLAAVISVSGGFRPDPQCTMNDILTDVFGEFGKRSRVPNLWIYSRSDKVFPPALTEQLHAAFLDGGGDVKFVQFHVDADVGNSVFTAARRQWMAQMDGYLQALQLPTWTMANVDQIIDKLRIKDSLKLLARTNLAGFYFPSPGEKAMAHSYAAAAMGSASGSSGASGFPWSLWSNAPSLEVARKSALEACAKRTNMECAIVMENHSWVGDKSP